MLSYRCAWPWFIGFVTTSFLFTRQQLMLGASNLTLDIREIIEEHIGRAEKAHAHPLKLIYLTKLMKDLLDIRDQVRKG